ncbi:hypothetical protein Tco_0739813, partial [Tanacetum coccineum]
IYVIRNNYIRVGIVECKVTNPVHVVLNKVVLEFPQESINQWPRFTASDQVKHVLVVLKFFDECVVCDPFVSVVIDWTRPELIHRVFTKKYAKCVGVRRILRLQVRGSAKNMVPILKGSDDDIYKDQGILNAFSVVEKNSFVNPYPEIGKTKGSIKPLSPMKKTTRAKAIAKKTKKNKDVQKKQKIYRQQKKQQQHLNLNPTRKNQGNAANV